jgi:hypothetical protein
MMEEVERMTVAGIDGELNPDEREVGFEAPDSDEDLM